MKFRTTFKKNKGVAIIVYWMLAVKGLIAHRWLRRSLKTGDRKKTTDNMSGYVEFCISQFNFLGFSDQKISSALEIGPGDNTALAEEVARRKGCAIDLVDKFQNAPIKQTQKDSDCLNRIRWLNANTRFATGEFFREERYDLIYSVSVIEHLWPWRKMLRDYVSSLKPFGVMYHIVNFTDHGLFTPFHDPFAFRRVPRILYEPAMRPIGRPNRALPSELVQFFNDMGFKVDVKVIRTHTRVLDLGEVYSLKSIPQEELCALQEGLISKPIEDENILDQCIGSALFKIGPHD